MNRGSSIDWGKYNLATQAFKKCEEDGNEGLSWGEVSACEVSKTKISSFLHSIFQNKLFTTAEK